MTGARRVVVPGALAALVAGTILAGLAWHERAHAVTQVPAEVAAAPRVKVDVWTNREEGGVYRPGEPMRVYFRTSADAYVLVYNIDTEGYIHLVYPYGPADPERVEGGRTYRIPARHDPYELVADGPPGMEYVVAVASRYPFQDLPWYLTGGDPGGDDRDEELESGVIVGDPYVGMERLNRRIIPSGREEDSDASETFFYIGRRVEYPRYVCADCHYHAFPFDPYFDPCPVVAIRIDATWVRYAPVHVRVARPRYYYYVRSSAPDRYRVWKERWSSLDGASTLRSRFVVRRSERSIRESQSKWRRQPPEFRDLRRSRPGRLWQGRDEILRLRERGEERGRGRTNPEVTPRSPERRPESRPDRPGTRERRGEGRDRGPAERERGDRESRKRGWRDREPRDREPADRGRGGDRRDERDRGREGREDRGRARDEAQWREREYRERQESRPRERREGEHRQAREEARRDDRDGRGDRGRDRDRPPDRQPDRGRDRQEHGRGRR